MIQLSTVVEQTNAGRVDRVVRELAKTSHSQSRGMIDQGRVAINGVACLSSSTLVAPGDAVTVRFDPQQRYREKKVKVWDDRTFQIHFEDQHLIVVNKVAGTLTVPTDNQESNTLIERVSVYLSHARGQRNAWLVHRLDRDVSGLLVFGKSEQIAAQLIEQFKHRKPRRIYAAIVAGRVAADEGTFESDLATGKNLDRFATSQSRKTQHAITHFRVQRRMVDTTQVEVTLETGRRNQIRVHFADAGHPVLGDPRYGAKRSMHPKWKPNRIALHAQSLGFEHPVSHAPLQFDSPLPKAIVKFLAAYRGDT
jgi:23S rRNA pseudouridine1911/1915/1917 synthase